jgi:hypothetical protein
MKEKILHISFPEILCSPNTILHENWIFLQNFIKLTYRSHITHKITFDRYHTDFKRLVQLSVNRTTILCTCRHSVLRLPHLLHQDPVPRCGGPSGTPVGPTRAGQEGEGAQALWTASHEQGNYRYLRAIGTKLHTEYHAGRLPIPVLDLS